MKTFKLFLIAALGVLVLCEPSIAIDVLEPGYTTETFVTYSTSGIGAPWSMTFTEDGNLYLTHVMAGSVWHVTPQGQATEFVSGFGSPCGIAWGGGTDYGNYLYMAESGADKVIKIATDGTTSDFAAISSGRHPGPLGIDLSGNYDGHMYVGTRAQDHTYEVDTSGSVSLFSDWPGWTDGGGPRDYGFDSMGTYGGLMFASAHFAGANQNDSGLFTIDTSGNASRFTTDIVTAFRIDFDLIGNFDSDLFVTGIDSWDQSMLSVWRVGSDGTATEFAQSSTSLHTMCFGPDGAMYVSEYSDIDETVTITRIIPEPATLLLLGLGGLLLRRKR